MTLGPAYGATHVSQTCYNLAPGRSGATTGTFMTFWTKLSDLHKKHLLNNLMTLLVEQYQDLGLAFATAL